MTATPIVPGRYSFNESQIDVVSLGSRTSVGNTSAIRTNSRAFLLQTQVANIGTSVVVRLEGSLDGVKIFSLGSDLTYTANGFFAATYLEIPVPWVRANLVTINTGTPTVSFSFSAF
jgi:hypothetical protein